MKPLAIPLCHQKTLGKSLVIAIPLIKLLAIPLGCQRTTTKWLVISRPKTATKWLVMLRCGKNFVLAYTPYAALRNFFRALLTIPHGAAFARSGSASPCGAFGRALNF